MKRAKKRYLINFTNDRGSGCFGTYAKREKAEAEMDIIMRHEAREIASGYADLHLTCEIKEIIIY